MRKPVTCGMLAAAGALAIVAPAGAKPPHPSHPPHPVTSHKCIPHNAAYITSGTLVSWSATKGSSGMYTGTITVRVTRTNHHAAGAKGSDATYTLDNTKVTLGRTADPPAAGDRVHLIGTVTELAKNCSATTGAGTITVRKVDVRAAKPTK